MRTTAEQRASWKRDLDMAKSAPSWEGMVYGSEEKFIRSLLADFSDLESRLAEAEAAMLAMFGNEDYEITSWVDSDSPIAAYLKKYKITGTAEEK